MHDHKVATRYRIVATVLIVAGIVGFVDLLTRSAAFNGVTENTGYISKHIFFLASYALDVRIATMLTTAIWCLLLFWPLMLSVGNMYRLKATQLETPSDLTERRIRRSKTLTGIVGALIIGAIGLSVSLAIANNSQFNSPDIESTASVATEAVVKVRCVVEETTDLWEGSGVIVSESGLIVTNAHVIPTSLERGYFNECFIYLPNPNTGELDQGYFAQPIVIDGLSNTYDLALMQITRASVSEEFPRKFPYVVMDPSCDETLKIGKPLLIYGYPTVSDFNLATTEGVVTSLLDDYMLTSAKIDAGNSGGLAIGRDGCFIGIPFAIDEGEYEQYGAVITRRAIAEFLKKVNMNAEVN